MTDPATSKRGGDLNVPIHGSALLGRHPPHAAMTTEVPERELDNLWDDGEFVLSRVRRNRDRPPALFVRPAAAHPADATIARLEHAPSLRGDLDSSWAAVPSSTLESKIKALKIDKRQFKST